MEWFSFYYKDKLTVCTNNGEKLEMTKDIFPDVVLYEFYE